MPLLNSLRIVDCKYFNYMNSLCDKRIQIESFAEAGDVRIVLRTQRYHLSNFLRHLLMWNGC